MSLNCAILFVFNLTLSFHYSSSTGSYDADGSLNEGIKRSKLSLQSKNFKVEISFAAKVPLQSVALDPKGVKLDSIAEDALRVLDVILRQKAASMYYFL